MPCKVDWAKFAQQKKSWALVLFGWVLELEANKIGENSQVSNYHRKKAPIGYIKNRYAEINLGGKNSPQKWQLWEGLLLLMFLYKTSNPSKKLFFSVPMMRSPKLVRSCGRHGNRPGLESSENCETGTASLYLRTSQGSRRMVRHESGIGDGRVAVVQWRESVVIDSPTFYWPLVFTLLVGA